MSQTHDLAHEFPEMKTLIHALKTEDRHFKRLFDKYEIVVRELHRGGEGAGGMSDEHAEILKKERLHLKDELFRMLKDKDSAQCCGCGG